jgi:hypothetical protein
MSDHVRFRHIQHPWTAFRLSRNQRTSPAFGQFRASSKALTASAEAHFRKVTNDQGQLIIDAVAGHLAAYRRRLENTLLEIAERISDPDIRKSQALVTHLDPFDHEAQEIVSALRRFQ